MSGIPFSVFARPALWQKSEAAFWDDGHISKYMLAAHLDENTDAASRGSGFMDKSVQWLSSLIPPGGRILDLGCGPGLYGARFAARGYGVTGIDCSRRSVAYAKEHDPASEYICENYLGIDYENEFDAVTLIYCDYAALIESERETLLGNVCRALRPGGLFALDVFSMARADTREETSWSANEFGGFWSPEPYVCLESRYLYENGVVSAHRYIILTDRGVTEHIVWDTRYSRESLSAELTRANLIPTGFFGDATGAEYTDESETICCLARKKANGL